MLGAFFIVHVGNGIFVGDGGYELVLALGGRIAADRGVSVRAGSASTPSSEEVAGAVRLLPSSTRTHPGTRHGGLRVLALAARVSTV